MSDWNTRHFHGTTNICRRRNKVEKLMNDNNKWVTQQGELKKMVTNFYKTLFSYTRTSTTVCLTNAFPQLDEEELAVIESQISNEEIYSVARRMGGFKAPGPDGL
uniref:Uncharacterized protein n=1 Tax=Cajanus cajan TaxID=3821 RepID=A0A151RN60_CAJCA|nr:hypothetical protein KK1_034556 [Cajanus cajan]